MHVEGSSRLGSYWSLSQEAFRSVQLARHILATRTTVSSKHPTTTELSR